MCKRAGWRCCWAQGKRYILPNTTVMMHHPSGVARGQASDIFNEARELMRVRFSREGACPHAKRCRRRLNYAQ